MSWILIDYCCAEHGRYELLEARPAPAATTCPECGADSPRAPSAVSGRVKMGEVTRGESQAPPPGAIDTRPLADGMGRGEWRRRRREHWRRVDHARELAGGLRERKIQI